MLRHRAAKALLALVGTCLLVGCADEQESLIVLGAPLWPDDGTCAVDSGEPDAFLLEGTLDLAWGTGYLMPVALRNNLPPRMTTNAGVDTNEMVLDSVDVELVMPQAPEIIDALADVDPAYVEFKVHLQTLSLAPGATYGQAVEVITAPAAQALSPIVLAEFGADVTLRAIAKTVFRAERSGNTSGSIGRVEARTFEFPITLCHNCLLTCATCEEATTCPPEGTTAFKGFICDRAQDASIVPDQCEDPA